MSISKLAETVMMDFLGLLEFAFRHFGVVPRGR
jgi:hypothetical protein